MTNWISEREKKHAKFIIQQGGLSRERNYITSI